MCLHRQKRATRGGGRPNARHPTTGGRPAQATPFLNFGPKPSFEKSWVSNTAFLRITYLMIGLRKSASPTYRNEGFHECRYMEMCVCLAAYTHLHISTLVETFITVKQKPRACAPAIRSLHAANTARAPAQVTRTHTFFQRIVSVSKHDLCAHMRKLVAN